MTELPEVAALPASTPVGDVLRLLRDGELEIVGRLVEASNATLYCTVKLGDLTASCVHKPIAGERPLWDFPEGTLAAREVAACAVSDVTGWRIVPPTVMRDGPFGPGMCQLWMTVDDTVDVVAMLRAGDPRLRAITVFDAMVNNADRKGGHLLPMPDGHLHAVDHGVCFAVENKLRTLLWNWAGDPIGEAELEVVRDVRSALDGSLGAELGALLNAAEIDATVARVDRLLATGVFPQPSDHWPAVPWPPF